MFRHSAKSLDAQEERLTASSYSVIKLNLPQAIVVRLHVRKINVVNFTPEMADTVGV